MDQNKQKGLVHSCTAIALLQIVQSEIDSMESHKFIFRQKVKQSARVFQSELESAIAALYHDMSEEAEMQLYKLQDEIKSSIAEGVKNHNSEFYKWLINEYEKVKDQE